MPRRDLAHGLEPSLHAVALAADVELPRGKYQGWSLAQLYDRDPAYVRWMAATWSGSLGRAASAFLAAVDPTDSHDNANGMGPANDRQAICQKIDKPHVPNRRRIKPSAKSKN